MDNIKEEIAAPIEAALEEQLSQPLLEDQPVTPGKPKKTPRQKAVRKTFKIQSMTLGLLGICGLSCFLVCLTDSFRDERGKVRYGLATCRGLWVIDGSVTIPAEEAAKYSLKLVDFFHAFLSIVVFSAIALFDQNVVKCFYLNPSDEAKELLQTLPIGVGVICSLLFVAFPTNRHGIGFPLSRR
ncbi:Protein DMP6 [Camellia lanceoleosa]|uniref:Protein DMP6 n=1 Tax=Camellia lanceoleosa TaxID=1840588 RepID=A0ACC0H914_9ERIC|nr:Protein DMP6 [Camellia lanceoleosa]